MQARLVLVLSLVGVLGGSCTAAPAPTTATAPTTSATTTTTEPPPVAVDLGGAPAGLTQAVEDLYLWAKDPSAPPPEAVVDGLAEHLAGLSPTEAPLEVSGEASTAAVPEAEVAVVTAGEDVVLAVDDGAGWSIVGARLERFGAGPWYGGSPRMALAIGSDARPGEHPPDLRADSLHLLTAVPDEQAGTIVGIPRDSWLTSPSGGRGKITDMMPRHGPEGILDTLRRETGLPLEGYLLTGFGGFVDLVEAFGPVEVDVPFDMAEPKSDAYLDAGPQELGGEDALAFSRNRTLPGGDLTRSFHQGMVIHAALVEARERGIGGLPMLLGILTEFAWTDLDAGTLLTLAASAYELDPDQVPNLVAPGVVGTAGAASVVYLTDDARTLFEDLGDGTLEETPGG